MLDLRLFQNPRFAVSSGGITLVFFAMFGTFFLLAQYLQGVLEYSPLGAAVRLLPFSVVMMAVAPQTPKLVARFGADRIGAAGLLLVGTGLVGIALFRTDTAYPQLVVTMCVLAAGMALTMTPMTTQLMAAVPRDRAGMGSATNDTTRELGGALGVAVLGSLLASQYASGVSPAVAGLPAELREVAEGSLGGVHGLIASGVVPAEQAGALLDVAKEAFVDGLTLAATVGACRRLIAADRRQAAAAVGPRQPGGHRRGRGRPGRRRLTPTDSEPLSSRSARTRTFQKRVRPGAPTWQRRGSYAGGDADAPRVQALREPHVRQRRHRAQVRPRPGARRPVAVPGQLPEVRAAARRRGLDPRLARRAADAGRAGERRRRHGRRPARRGRGPPQLAVGDRVRAEVEAEQAQPAQGLAPLLRPLIAEQPGPGEFPLRR